MNAVKHLVFINKLNAVKAAGEYQEKSPENQLNQLIKVPMFKSIIKLSLICSVLLLIGLSVAAQDTSKKKTIDITSTFKPVLREAVKINFNAAPPAVDPAATNLRYNIPSQNLSFGYQPAPLNPVALQVDSIVSWQSSNYIKAGIGNAYIPFVQAALSFGNGERSFFNVFANHFTSKGSLPFQKNNQTGVALNGTVKTEKKLEWSGKVGFRSDDYFFYGYQPDTKLFTKEELRQGFQTFEGQLSLRNIEPTTYGLNYYPNLKVSVFNGRNNIRKASEANTVLNLPLQKTFGKSFGLNVGFTADLTNFRRGEKGDAQNNNIYYFTPSLLLKTPNLYLETGIIPSWDNKVFKMLPNFLADISTDDKRFTLQLGWIGYYKKGSYERFAGINPWIMQPDSLLNTRVSEKYAGFKGSVLNHFTYSVRLGYLQYKNLALFINDTVDGKTFLTRYASVADALQWTGEIGYTQGEKFSATAGLTWNKFVRVKDEAKAWGILPIELHSGLRWQIIKDLWFKSDLYAFESAHYRNRDEQPERGDPGIDLGAGLEFKITRQFNLWMQMNNIFNNKYQRWNQYPVYGFNILGGIVFSFNQK